MPHAPDTPSTTLQNGIAELIERVLMVDRAEIVPDAELVTDLGAESIDFLDLIFGLEDLIGTRIPPERWAEWVSRRLENPERGAGITVAVVTEFAAEQLDGETSPGSAEAP